MPQPSQPGVVHPSIYLLCWATMLWALISVAQATPLPAQEAQVQRQVSQAWGKVRYEDHPSQPGVQGDQDRDGDGPSPIHAVVRPATITPAGASIASSDTSLAAAAGSLAPASAVREGCTAPPGGEDVTLRIMPLGASITYGQGSSDGNGYRQYLRDMLVADGYVVDYVGSRCNGTMYDNDVEGWPGYRIDEVAAKANESVPTYLPNLVLLNAGTNNCLQNRDWETAAEQMIELFEQVRTASTRVSIVLSTLLVNTDDAVDECVRRVNDQFRALVLDQQARSRKVVLAEMYGPGAPTVDDLVDSTHPGDVGFQNMAAIWFDSIKDAASRGWLEAPQVLPPPPPADNSTESN